MKYLGVPISDKSLKVSQWAQMEEKFEKKLGVCQGRFLSLGGRLILINSSLSNIPLYMLFVFFVPSTVLKKDIYRKDFCSKEKKIQKMSSGWMGNCLYTQKSGWFGNS